MLLSTGLFHVLAGFVALDMTLAAAVTGAMASFIAMAESSDRKNKNVFNFLFFLALGIGFLTKGPVVLALCVGAIFIAVVLSRSLSNLKVPSWLLGGIVFLAIVIPWMVVAEKQSPGILKYFFLNENVLRFLKSDYGDRYGYAHNFPPGAILIFLMLGCLPWTPLYFLAFWRVFRSEGRASHADTLLLGWALSSVALFFFSRNIAATYVLPSVPAFAILGARYLSQAQSMVIRSPLRFSTLASLAPGLMLCFSVFFAREIGRIRSTGEVVKAVQERAPATGNPILFFDEVPYSAEFYSGGNVLPLYHSTRALSEKMASAPRSIVIVHEKSEKPLQEFIPSRLKLLFAVGSQHVYQMN
jgi:4-amino-4-deoxy-L-arabinose transferase-like glycosyltransferase